MAITSLKLKDNHIEFLKWFIVHIVHNPLGKQDPLFKALNELYNKQIQRVALNITVYPMARMPSSIQSDGYIHIPINRINLNNDELKNYIEFIVSYTFYTEMDQLILNSIRKRFGKFYVNWKYPIKNDSTKYKFEK